MPSISDALRSLFPVKVSPESEPTPITPVSLQPVAPVQLEKKESAANRVLLQIVGNHVPVWMKPSYEAYAKEGYAKNIYVYRCIRVLSDACAGVPWKLFERRRSGKVEEYEGRHDLKQLLHRPNPRQSRAMFMRYFFTYLNLAGNSYIEMVGPEDNGRVRPKEIYTHRPDRIKILPGNPQNPILGYRYEIGPNIQDFPEDRMIHVKFPHPFDDWYGMSPLTAAAMSADQSNSSKAWNVGMLQNASRPSGLLTIKEGVYLSDDEVEDLKRTIKESYSGSGNAGRIMLLEADVEWHQISLSPAEMSWVEGNKISAREIALAFGVPPEMIGDSTNRTNSNMEVSQKQFYVESVMPMLDFLKEELNHKITPRFGDNLILDYDKDQIVALQDDRKIIWVKVKAATFLTENEKRKLLGMDAAPWGEVRVFPSSMFQIDPDGQVTAAMPMIGGADASGSGKPKNPAKPVKKYMDSDNTDDDDDEESPNEDALLQI
jgi:HK97 family phage portal protein